MDHEAPRGHLIVIEGTDGVGRSTQIGLLVPWLEANGYPVVQTGWNRSLLVSKLITSAKEGTLLNKVTFSLLYATDFADRLERVVIPALKSGMTVVADRYVATALARSGVRGVDKEWLNEIYSFAPNPDLTLYMHLGLDELLHRTLDRTSLNYWESGMDQHMGEDIYESFAQYQSAIIADYEKMAQQQKWQRIDARTPIADTQREIRTRVAKLLEIPSDRIAQQLRPVPAPGIN